MTNDAKDNGGHAPMPGTWSPERGPVSPAPDRLTTADRERIRAEYEAAATTRRTMLSLNAPWWMRALALLPNPKAPLERWIETYKARLRDRR